LRRKLNHQKKLALPSIVFANARSINNKLDEFNSLVKYHHAYRNASALALTETWLKDTTTDDHLAIPGYDLFRADRAGHQISGKRQGGGVLWYVNKEWCTNTTVHRVFASQNLELLHLECRPHYLPREINIVNLLVVYIPPDADAKAAQSTIDDILLQCTVKHPESASIIVGDFNHVTLDGLEQYVTFNTRGHKTLDLCYSNVKGAYKCYKLPPIKDSDHAAVQVCTTYITRHRKSKYNRQSKTIISDDTIDRCKHVFETTDWDIFFCDDLDTTVETITDYINFTVQEHSTTKTYIKRHQHKPWLTRNIKHLLQQKTTIYQSGLCTNDINKQITLAIKEAKLQYRAQELDSMTGNIKRAWHGIKAMGCLTRHDNTVGNQMPKAKTTISGR
jgi:hypothetical protein